MYSFTTNFSYLLQNKADSINIPLYNAVMILAEAIELAIYANYTPANGKAVAMAIKNTSFEGAGNEQITVNTNGDITYYFHLMDYNSRQNRVQSVLVTLPSSDRDTLEETNASIIWPNGRRLEPDTCDFTLCEDSGEFGCCIFWL